jgi:DUF971 family protein
MSEVRLFPFRPVRVARNGPDGLLVDWDDGHRSVYAWLHLRKNCPCAGCRDERERPADPFRILSATELAPRPALEPTRMEPVGHYAYKITWNDGHDTGIYTLEHLRELCECPACRPAASSEGPGPMGSR